MDKKNIKKSIFELFDKYTPSETEKKILSSANDYKVFISKKDKAVQIELYFNDIIDRNHFKIIENNIKDTYDLNDVRIKTKYPEEKFNEKCFEEIINEANDYTSNTCFLEGASYFFDGNKIFVSLVHGAKDYLENAANFFKLLEKIIYEKFNIQKKIVGTGITKLEFDEEKYIEKNRQYFKSLGNIIINRTNKINETENANYSKKMKAGANYVNSSDAVTNIDSSDNPKNELDTSGEYRYDSETKIAKLGHLEVDLTEIKPLYGEAGEVDVQNLMPLKKITDEDIITACGKIFDIKSKEIKKINKKTLSVSITNYDSSMEIRMIGTYENMDSIEKSLKKGKCILVQGESNFNKFDNELVIEPTFIGSVGEVIHKDESEEKRVELHLHTVMSAMDSNISPEMIVEHAIGIGHKAVAITDHGNVQAFPEVMQHVEKLKSDLKIIYGIEAYYIDDSKSMVFGKHNAHFWNDTFIVFDIETTGLSPINDGITEIGAVKIKNGEVLEYFNTFVNSKIRIPEKISELTGITDEMVKDAPLMDAALKEFLKFAGNHILIAHNANFDIGFIKKYCADYKINFTNSYIDTLSLSRNVNSELKNHRLDTLVKHYKLGDFRHHRASDDAEILARIFFKMCTKLKDEGITSVFELNERTGSTKNESYHMIILVKNNVGLKNLYKLVSASYTEYFYRRARIPKSLLDRHRDGLIIGSACESGELYKCAVEGGSMQNLREIASYYDFLEVQPVGNNEFLVLNGTLQDKNAIQEINKKIIGIGEKLNIPVVATGDVHFLRKHDGVSRKILLNGMKYSDADRDIPLYYRTTEEMMQEFSYLTHEKAYEIVVTNTNKIADMTERIRPIPKGTYPPKIEGAEEKLEKVCYETAEKMYKSPLPEIVKARIEKELTSIIKNGFAVMYVIARELIMRSEELGYLVGSRGSVGSSFIATLAGISEVNPLPPHYYCKSERCSFCDFITDGSVGSGFDLPEKKCPECGLDLAHDGQDIPFETFLGFNGEKAPDIDLNFSGYVQSDAHKYTEVIFGSENVFRAGTIGALASKTAFGFVSKYLEEKKYYANKAHTDYLVDTCVGVKRTTGQHPGGVIVIPREYDIYDFTPVQHPADDVTSGVVTTHFAFEFLHDTILKLDLLGHDVPTKYKFLEIYTNRDVRNLPMNDPAVLELFRSTKSIGVNPSDIGSDVATFGLPEMGTRFVRQMLFEAKPKCFADLLQISGLSHGKNVWNGNAQDLVKNGTCTISEVIGTRDNIMIYLIHKGLNSSVAFKITEDVRKGKGLTPEYEKIMHENGVPEWYISSCKKIKYMFPKAHASAYVIAAMRLGWFKIYEPIAFYASYFTVQPEGFDAELALGGKGAIRNYIAEIEKKGNEASQKENETVATMQIALEMLCRGLKFLPVDIYKSDSREYKIENGALRLPFSSINGVGENAAANIVSVREACGGEIFSIEDLKKSAKLTKTVIDTLRKNRVFGSIPETDQISMF